MREVVLAAWTNPYRTKSDFARKHASYVAAAACRGLITVEAPDYPGCYGIIWYVTGAGIAYAELKAQE